MKNTYLLSLFLVFLSINSYARPQLCKVNAYRALNHSASIDKKITYAYQSEGEINGKTPGLLINKCKDAGLRRKYLLLGNGPTVHGIKSSHVSVSYNDVVNSPSCKIENTGFPTFDLKTRRSFFKNKKTFMNECVTGKIRQWSRKKLTYTESQDNCQLTKIDDQTSTFKGGTCFFRIFPDSEFVVTYSIDKKCTDENFLKTRGIEPQEINTMTTVNIAGDDSGSTYDLTLIGSRVVNFQIEPSKKMISLSDDWGINVPQVPARFELPDVQMAGLEITEFGKRFGLKPSWAVSNLCEKKSCFNGLCTSTCNYSKPLFGEISLYEVENGKKYYLSSWFEGGIIPANWQGTFEPQLKNFNQLSFVAGKKYILEVEFKDPKFDYDHFGKTVSSFFKPILGIPNVDFAISLASGIPLLRNVTGITTIGTINTINMYNGSGNLGRFIEGEGIDTLSNFNYWPPIYKEVCLIGSPKCAEVSNRPYLTLGMSFEVGEKQADSYEVPVIKVKTFRKSRILGNINYTEQIPHTVCE
ncbi:hypothetical protein A9Q84_02645 [Halobacteriovorax marinus]|uniref:Uncharacterized protein n=1 Tax=Halobacteriovorax marinus TaxID=97084 RepID=A0A1Y5FJA8_9BACT|nr:hypothetical protein A9Q84_02645 [Halobacteriovorax marinus]